MLGQFPSVLQGFLQLCGDEGLRGLVRWAPTTPHPFSSVGDLGWMTARTVLLAPPSS